jgi:FkbM family methyltransferase
MFSGTARALGALKQSLRSMTQLLDVQRAALDHERTLVVAAVDDFVRRAGFPTERLHHCRFITKKRLLELYEHDVVYDGTVQDGCLFFDIKRDIRLFVPFTGFDEYIGLCWDVFVQGYAIDIRKPFVFIDVGANLFNASLLFARNPLCTKVFAYELIPAIYRMGIRNLELNPQPADKIAGRQFGLYNCDKTLEVTYYPSRSGASGISEKLKESEWLASTDDSDFVDPGRRQHLAAPVKEACSEIQAHATQHPNEEVVVKLDAENSEYEIIENLLPLLPRLYCICVELHSRSGSERIASLLSGRDYRMTPTADNVVVYYNQARAM